LLNIHVGILIVIGLVRRPAGPREDAVPVLISNGEFVVNAPATAKHRGVLEAINNESRSTTGSGYAFSDSAGTTMTRAAWPGVGVTLRRFLSVWVSKLTSTTVVFRCFVMVTIMG
jgi:hypothetical protein